MRQSKFVLISTVVKRVSQEEEFKSIRWQFESVATCVQRLLRVKVAFPFIGRPTVEAKDTVVLNATSHSAKQVV